MRSPITVETIHRFMERLGRVVPGEGRVYFTGGVSALLMGWRETTVDIDVHAEPEPAGFFEALPGLKAALDINVELAAPFHFIPAARVAGAECVHRATREDGFAAVCTAAGTTRTGGLHGIPGPAAAAGEF